MVNKVFKWLLLFSPIAYTTGMQLGTFDITFFKLGTIVLFIASLFDKQAREIDREIIYTIVSLMALCFIGLYIHKFAPIILKSYINLSFAVVLLVTLLRYVTNVKQFYKYIIIAGILNMILFATQRLELNLIFNAGKTQGLEGGLIGNGPRLIIYLTLILPLLLNKSILFCIPVIATGIVMREYSFIPILLLILFYKLNKHTCKKITLATTAIIFSLLIWQYYPELKISVMVRIDLWIRTIRVILQYPSVGYGLGSLPIAAPEFMEKIGAEVWYRSAFNDYLEFIFAVGLGGIAWLAYAGRQIWKRARLNIETVTLLSMLILMTFEYPLIISRLWFTIVFIITAFIIKNAERRKQWELG